jgi:TRAP-type mannitol/chloroaromatic compound transport system permease small subunit
MATAGENIQGVFFRIGRAASLVGGVALLASAFLIAFEVVSRKVFNYSTAAADEFSGYAYALSTAWGFAYVALRGEHVRVDALRVHLPQWARSFLDIIAHLAFAGLMSLLCWRAFLMLHESWRIGATSNTPIGIALWIPQSIWLVGLVFCTLTLILLLVRSVAALFQGNLDLVEHIAEPKSGKKDLQIADAAG